MNALLQFRLWLARQTASTITLRASDGRRVRVHPDFASSYWRAPWIWQSVVDDAARWEVHP